VPRAEAPGFVVTKPATPAHLAAVVLAAAAAGVMPTLRGHLVVGTSRAHGLGARSRVVTTGRSAAPVRVALAGRLDRATSVRRAVSPMIGRRAVPGMTGRCPAGVRSAATTLARLVDP
jgi:hypothetical protein